jgi:hypothetical protein
VRAKAEQSEIIKRALAMLHGVKADQGRDPKTPGLAFALAATREPAPDYRSLYEEMARAIPEDFHIVDSWLCDHHPVLWQQIRELDNALSRMEKERAPEAVYQAKLHELVTLCHEAKALREGHWGVLLVKSTLLGCEVWVIREERDLALVQDNDRPVFFADEIELLKTKSPEHLRDILKVKAAFPGCRVIQ